MQINSKFHKLVKQTQIYFTFSASLINKHGLRTPNEGKNQRNLKIRADVADKICFGRS